MSVHHWVRRILPLPALRDESLRFENGQLVMPDWWWTGAADARHSVASANWEEHLEFFSIKVQDGPLTSLHTSKPATTLISKTDRNFLAAADLNLGQHLYCWAPTRHRPFLEHHQRPWDLWAIWKSSCTSCALQRFMYYDRLPK